MNLLIHTVPHDGHADAVSWAATKTGHRITRLYAGDFPGLSRASLEIDHDFKLDLNGPGSRIREERFDCIWHRRKMTPQVSENVHIADLAFARSESCRFMSAIDLLGAVHDSFEVNNAARAAVADVKPYQLSIAARAGFSIPKTLCSNDIERIRRFILELGGAGIFKPFRTTTWQDTDGKLFTSYASAITLSDLSNCESISAAPGIYQEAVPKREELRVTIMGHTVFQAAIISSTTDWRRTSRPQFRPPEVPLSELEVSRCLDLMRRMGLVFGCIDVIRRPDGKLVFLEINEMGQWLFVEQSMPELPMLDAFVSFLGACRPDFRYQQKERPFTLAEYLTTSDAAASAETDSSHAPAPSSIAADGGHIDDTQRRQSAVT